MINKKRVACIIPPYYRLMGSKNNRLTPAMHYVAEILHNRGHEVLFTNGDFADETVCYADRLSLAKNNWLLSKEYLPFNPVFDDIFEVLSEVS